MALLSKHAVLYRTVYDFRVRGNYMGSFPLSIIRTLTHVYGYIHGVESR
jgi:hypothetical protein